MSVMNKIFGKSKGHQCSKDAQGNIVCDVYEVDGNKKIATGTHVGFQIDSNSCEPMLNGDLNAINEEDEEYVKKIADSLRQGCKKGIA